VREIRLLRSTSGVWKRFYGRATKAPPHERGGNRHARPTATAPHLDSTRWSHSHSTVNSTAVDPLQPFAPDFCSIDNASYACTIASDLICDSIRTTARRRRQYLKLLKVIGDTCLFRENPDHAGGRRLENCAQDLKRRTRASGCTRTDSKRSLSQHGPSNRERKRSFAGFRRPDGALGRRRPALTR
jgi:hypothetical protein